MSAQQRAMRPRAAAKTTTRRATAPARLALLRTPSKLVARVASAEAAEAAEQTARRTDDRGFVLNAVRSAPRVCGARVQSRVL